MITSILEGNMRVELTKPQIRALLYAAGDFTEHEGTGDKVLDRTMKRAESRLNAALCGRGKPRRSDSIGHGRKGE